MNPSSGIISISASTRKLEVDNRISLRFYYRIADNLLKQANIFREENNVIDLYIMLLRFSSLITETLISHKDFQTCMQREKLLFRKKLPSVLNELESLKPDVRNKIEDLNNKSRKQQSKGNPEQQNFDTDDPFLWPPTRKVPQINHFIPSHKIVGQDGISHDLLIHPSKVSHSRPIEHKSSLSVLQPKADTLARHSILGPNGLHGQWRPPSSNRGIQYPKNLDLPSIELPSTNQQMKVPIDVKEDSSLVQKKSLLEEVLSLNDHGLLLNSEENPSNLTSDLPEAFAEVTLNKQPSPPPVPAQVIDLAGPDSEVSNSPSAQSLVLKDDLARSETPLEVHISTTMMESFLRVAKSNTDRNLETCGVLAGSLKNRKFYVTALIIPKQESTSDSCQTTNEEEIFDYQDEKSLFPLGWIHTHPTQSCFMSSIDLHTHYSYQIMLPESIAIVMAPKGGSRTHGIFRLTSPGGISLIRQCQLRGFHPHPELPDGGRIYDHCSDVYMDPNLKFDVVDLR